MEVAVNIAAIMPDKPSWMHRNVREDEAAEHGAVAMMKIGATNVVEVLKIELCRKAIVVASNQHFPSIEPFHEAQTSFGESHIAQNVHCVPFMHSLVPSLFQVLLHLF